MESIYEKIGFKGLLWIVCDSCPLSLFFISIPYGLKVYHGFLNQSNNLEQLLHLHEEKYLNSIWFKMLRPKYRIISQILKEDYKIE